MLNKDTRRFLYDFLLVVNSTKAVKWIGKEAKNLVKVIKKKTRRP